MLKACSWNECKGCAEFEFTHPYDSSYSGKYTAQETQFDGKPYYKGPNAYIYWNGNDGDWSGPRTYYVDKTGTTYAPETGGYFKPSDKDWSSFTFGSCAEQCQFAFLNGPDQKEGTAMLKCVGGGGVETSAGHAWHLGLVVTVILAVVV